MNKKTESSRGYYPTGEIRYEVKTIYYNHKDEFNSEGKKVIRLKEFYPNGKKLLVEKKVFPAVIKENHLSEKRHLIKQPYIRQKFVKYTIVGKKIEKYRLWKYELYKKTRYNYDQYNKVITRNDPEGNIKERKIGNQRKSIENKLIDPTYK